MPPPVEERPLTTQQVADMFGVSPSAVVQWAEEEKLTYFRTPGGHRRFHRTDVEAFRAKTTREARGVA